MKRAVLVFAFCVTCVIISIDAYEDTPNQIGISSVSHDRKMALSTDEKHKVIKEFHFTLNFCIYAVYIFSIPSLFPNIH